MQAVIALFMLTLLEIVLGIDNVVFISILAGKLPEEKQGRARTVGLLLAMVMRLILLGAAYWIVEVFSSPFFHLPWPTETITNDAGDPITGTAEYKVCAVRVQPLRAAAK